MTKISALLRVFLAYSKKLSFKEGAVTNYCHKKVNWKKSNDKTSMFKVKKLAFFIAKFSCAHAERF